MGRFLKRKHSQERGSFEGNDEHSCKKVKSSSEGLFRSLQKKSDNLKATLREQLECPVCLSVPNTCPVFQCNNGHLICCNCREKLVTCPVCRVPLGYSRNLTSEKLISILCSDKNEPSNQIPCN